MPSSTTIFSVSTRATPPRVARTALASKTWPRRLLQSGSGERHKEMLAELDRTGESQISLTDPDSRAMAAHTHVAVGYNVQIAVDVKHKLIVEQQVTNQVVDMGLLAQTAEPAKEVLGVERIAVVADRGYFKIEDIEACEKAGIDPYVPRPQRGPAVRAGLFRKDEFRSRMRTS